MRPGHCDVELVADSGEVPGRAEGCRLAGPVGINMDRLLAGPRGRGHPLLLQVDLADRVVLRVGDVEGVAVLRQRHPLRLVELG